MKQSFFYLFLVLLLCSCASTHQILDRKVFWKKDVGLTINGVYFEGVATVPRAKKYHILIEPRGDVDLIIIKSCHGTFSAEKKTKKFLGIRVGPRKFAWTYENLSPVEIERTCPLMIDVYESSQKARHSWALIFFEDPNYKLKVDLLCNWMPRATINGVGSCQAKADSYQRIVFKEDIRLVSPEPSDRGPCNSFKKVAPHSFDLKVSPGKCHYHFDTRDKRKAKITFVGFEGVPVREAQ